MQNGLQTLDSTRKTLKSWRTLKKASLNRGFSLKNLDLVKVFLLTKNFTKSGLYCIIRIIQSCMFSFFSSFCCNCMVSKLICDSRSSLCIVHIIQSLIHCILPQIRRLFKNKVTIATKVKRTRDMM